jgi:hypothetical protein
VSRSGGCSVATLSGWIILTAAGETCAAWGTHWRGHDGSRESHASLCQRIDIRHTQRQLILRVVRVVVRASPVVPQLILRMWQSVSQPVTHQSASACAGQSAIDTHGYRTVNNSLHELLALVRSTHREHQ